MKESVLAKANAMKGVNDISLKGEIVVFGSTYLAGFPFYELINKCKIENAVYNRSIEGLTIDEASLIMHDLVVKLQPSKVFLALGEEDADNPAAIIKYSEIVRTLRSALPSCTVYLIGLEGDGDYVKKFNANASSLCDGKKVKYIKFVSGKATAAATFRARFKQMSCFFRNEPLNLTDAFAVANA